MVNSRDKEYFKDKEVSFSINNNPKSMDAVIKGEIVRVMENGFLVNIVESYHIEPWNKGIIFIPYSAGICFKIL